MAGASGHLSPPRTVFSSRSVATWGVLALSLATYLTAAVFVARLTWLHSHDDAYITYTFARNLAEGNGLTWNGDPGLGTTSPLLAVLLGTAERLLPLGIPTWGHLLAWAANFATACSLLALGRHGGWPLAGFLAGLGWLVSPAAVDFAGGEYPVAVACVAGAAVAAGRRSSLGLAAALALAVGLRNEMAVAACLLALAALWSDGWRRARGWLVPGAAGALALWGAWLLTLYALAGTTLPGTLAAKRAQADSVFPFWGGGAKFLSRVVESARDFFYPAGASFFAVLAALGALHLVRRAAASDPDGGREHGRGWLFAAALLVWGPLHVVALAALDVPFYPWYTLPLHFSLLVAACLTVEVPARFPPRLRRGLAVAGAVAVGGLLLLNGARNLKRHTGVTEDVREAVYRRLAAWTGERYPRSTRLASFEVGYLGYYGRFHTVDLLGLTTPATPLEAVRRGDFPEVTRVLAPDLLLLPEPFVELGKALVGDPRDFLARYRLDHVDSRGWLTVLVYRRAGFAGRGEVADDLLARLAAEEGARIEYRARLRRGAPALVLAPGEAVRLALDPSAAGAVFAARLAPERPGRIVARVRLERAGAEVAAGELATEREGWQEWELPLPADGGGPATLELACAAQSAAPCLVATPHLRRAS